MSYNSIPTASLPLSERGATNRAWYFFFQALFRGVPPGAESSVTPTGSPFAYTALSGGFLIVQGGTVSAITLARNGGTPHNVGVTAGIVPASQGDQITITYTVAPTLTFVPT